MSPLGIVVLGLGAVLLVTVWIAVAAWVGLDARARGSAHPILWALFAPVPGVVLLYYVAWWRRRHDRVRPQSPKERYAGVVASAGLGGFLVAAVVSPPDPFTQLLAWPIAFACCLPVAYWLTGGTQPASRNAA